MAVRREGWRMGRKMPFNWSSCPIFQELNFFFSYTVYVFSPNCCWFSPQLCLQKPFVKSTGRYFGKKGVRGSRKDRLDSWIWPLVPNSPPWELPEEMPLPGLVTFANGFFPLCVRNSWGLINLKNCNNRKTFNIVNTHK